MIVQGLEVPVITRGVCYADGCETQISLTRLMCWDHWKRVPRVLNREIFATHGQDVLAYLRATAAAHVALRIKDGSIEPPAAVELMAEYGLGVDGYPLKERA